MVSFLGCLRHEVMLAQNFLSVFKLTLCNPFHLMHLVLTLCLKLRISRLFGLSSELVGKSTFRLMMLGPTHLIFVLVVFCLIRLRRLLLPFQFFMYNLRTDGLGLLFSSEEGLRLRVWHLMISYSGPTLVCRYLPDLVLM